MKKEYSKPTLYAELFLLAEHISAGCVQTGLYTPNHSNAWVCSVTDGGGTTLFMEGQERCSVEGGNQLNPELEGVDEIIAALLGGQCYNTVTSGPMFSS